MSSGLEMQVEPWLRGTHGEVAPVQRAVVHALELVREDGLRWTGELTAEQVGMGVFGMASVAFQMRHIARSLDRLLTYAEGGALTEAQLAALRDEAADEVDAAAVRAEFDSTLQVGIERVRRVRPEQFEEIRGVGRARLPTTVVGLLIHLAEHSQRHVGQLITTAKVVREITEEAFADEPAGQGGTKQAGARRIAEQRGAGEAFAEVAALLARLRAPDGCPWDLAQTLDTIKPHTLEEVYEVFDAIDRRAWDELRDELGDLLLQVLFYAQIAKDESRFGIEDVVRGLGAKLVRRHPHVFGDAIAATPEAVNATWERVKQQEKLGAEKRDKGLLDEVPHALPALVEAGKIGKKAAKIGFDWPDAAGLFDKLQEEVAELRAEVDAESRDAALVEEELGDLLFVLTNLGRHLGADPEQALKKANAKFRRRFAAMEKLAGDAERLRSLHVDQMEDLWRSVKMGERKRAKTAV